MTTILIVAFALRVGFAASDDRFHPDEALFSTFARHAALNGDWLLHGSLDKPPLTIYASALSMTLFVARPRETVLDFNVYQGEFAARLPSLFSNLIILSASYATAKRLYQRERVRYWAAALICTSPLAVVFSATAFTDGLMLGAGALAIWAAAYGRWGWVGFWIGAAFACKQQGFVFLPLALWVGWAADRLSMFSAVQIILPLLSWSVALILWEGARGQDTGYWALATANNDVLRLINIDELPYRIAKWGVLIWSIFTMLGVGLFVRQRCFDRRTRYEKRIDAALGLFLLGYIGLHIVIAFNLYDRYTLPLLIPGALLSASGIEYLMSYARRFRLTWIAIPLITTLFAANAAFAVGRLAPVGGDGTDGHWGVYTGIDQVADYLNSKPVATVIYDRWLGWELGYYMGEWNDKRRVYFPTPEALSAGAAALDETAPRFWVIPDDESATVWIEALKYAGFTVTAESAINRFLIYRIDRLGTAS